MWKLKSFINLHKEMQTEILLKLADHYLNKYKQLIG